MSILVCICSEKSATRNTEMCIWMQWSDQLQQLDFQEMVLFLQHLPTKNWTHQELEMVLSRAFMWRVMFDGSPSHLNSSS